MEKRRGIVKWESHREEALRACSDLGSGSEDRRWPCCGGPCQEVEGSGQGRKQCSQEGDAARTWHVSGNPSEGACKVGFLQEADRPEAAMEECVCPGLNMLKVTGGHE